MSARVSRIRIRNVLGIEELEITPGEGVTLVTGKNGSGKTSLVEAIRSAVKGGHDATLLRKGAEEGEIVLLLDDEVEVRKRITEATSDVTVRHPDFGKVSAPQTWLNGIIDVLSVNPVEFLTAGRRRLEYLLDALPLELPADQLAAAAGEHVDITQVAHPDQHPLDVVDAVRRALYDDRTGVNRVAKENAATVEELRKSLPEDAGDEEGLEAALEQLDARISEITDKATQTVLASQEKRDQLSAAAMQGKAKAIQEIERAHAEAVRRADRSRDEAIQAIETQTREMVDEYREAHAKVAREAHPQMLPELEQLKYERTLLHERRRTAAQTANTRRMIEAAEARAQEAHTMSRELTEALARVDALRLGLLSQIPIEGLEVQDGELLVDGVPFDRVNHARQVQVAVEVAKLRAGKLPLVCVDGLELLDTQTFQLFVDALEASGLQSILTRVSDQEQLTVEAAR